MCVRPHSHLQHAAGFSLCHSCFVSAHRHGFQLVVAVMLGAVQLMVVALIVTNLHKDRAYPTFWW